MTSPSRPDPAGSATSPPASPSAPSGGAPPAPRHLLHGALLVLAGTVLFSSKAIFVKLAYLIGPQLDAITIMAYRMGFALPLFFLVALVSGRRPGGRLPRGRLLWAVAGVGLLGYYVAMLADLSGLKYISAGLERLILFIYPTLVVVMVALRGRTPIGRRVMLALAATYGGVALAVGDALKMEGDQVVLGSLLVLASAVAFALFNIGAGELIGKTGSMPFTSVAMGASAVAALVHYLIQHGPAAPRVPAGQVVPFLAICLAMAVLATVLPSYLIAAGIGRIGAGPSAILQTVGPLATIAMAAVVLGETVTPLQLAGAGLIVLGVWAVGREKAPKNAG